MSTAISAAIISRAMRAGHHWRCGAESSMLMARKLVVSKVSVAAGEVGVASASEASFESGSGAPA